jgi:hypothetical protein
MGLLLRSLIAIQIQVFFHPRDIRIVDIGLVKPLQEDLERLLA